VTWSGRKVAAAREEWAARLPLPCALCPLPVDGATPWVVEHLVPRSYPGAPADTDASNQWVSHRTCSDRQGGRLGAAKTNGRRAERPTRRMQPERARGIRGI